MSAVYLYAQYLSLEWLMIDYCVTSNEQYFSYIPDKNKLKQIFLRVV